MEGGTNVPKMGQGVLGDGGASFNFLILEAVPQLLLAPKNLLLFGFEALFAFLFLPILDCWTASLPKKSLLLIADHQNLGMRKGREVEKA